MRSSEAGVKYPANRKKKPMKYAWLVDTKSVSSKLEGAARRRDFDPEPAARCAVSNGRVMKDHQRRHHRAQTVDVVFALGHEGIVNRMTGVDLSQADEPL